MGRTSIILATFLLLSVPACTEEKSNGKREALLSAIDQGDIRSVKRLAESGCDISSPDRKGNHLTPLMWTINYQRKDIFLYLLSRGPDLNQKNGDGETVLHFAVYGRDANVDLVEALIKQGADVNARDKKGASVLSYAKAQPPAPTIVDLLRKAGARD